MKNYFDTNDEEKIHQFTHNLAPQAVEMIQKAQLAEELRNQANTCIKKIKNKEDLFNDLNLDKSKYKDQIEQWAFESPQQVLQIIEYLHEQNNLQEAEAEEQKQKHLEQVQEAKEAQRRIAEQERRQKEAETQRRIADE